MRNSRIVLTLPLLLAALPAGADTSFTGTGWLNGVPVPGILCTNGSGQVYFKGNVHTLRIMADNNTNITGRMQGMPDVAFQPNGTRLFTGTAYSEVGTWDAATNFTASGGVWELRYTGVTQADGSIRYDFVGYGIGGAIDGLRTEITAERGPGATFDPSIPYDFSGMIKPAPVNICALIDDFEDGDCSAWQLGANAGWPGKAENGGHFTLNCDWTGIPTVNPVNTLAWAGHRGHSWTISDARTLELRADLVGLNPAADAATLGIAVQEGGPNYILVKGHTWLILVKHNGTAFAALCGKTISTPDTGVVMSLALTKVGQNLILAGRVFDRASTNLLGQISYEDTPASDAVLSPQQIADLVGGPVPGYGPDPGPFWTAGQNVWVGVWQCTDGTKPIAEAVFDNVQLSTNEVPLVGIEHAVRLSWPATGQNYAPQWAPTPEGPWQLVPGQAIPAMNQVTIPTSGAREFYRLIQAP